MWLPNKDDPPLLSVGTEVSAKYKGAFCEAKVHKVVKVVKIRVTFKFGQGGAVVSDENVKGVVKVGSQVKALHPDKNSFIDAVITKIQDCSTYTVVFDDGDITTLRRTSLCLKSGRHFAQSETLDQLPLTHPEHFGTPVVGGRKGRRSLQKTDSDESSDEEENDVHKRHRSRREEWEKDIGKVVCVEMGDDKRQKDNWFPGLVVAPTAQGTVKIETKKDYIVRSFQDGRYYTVPKKEASPFRREKGRKVSHGVLKIAVDKALQFITSDELPPNWDRDLLFGTNISDDSDQNGSDSESSGDEPVEEKDHFVAQLYKYMEECGTPINKGPTVGNRDLDLYKLFMVVQKFGGFNRVMNQNQWKIISNKMGLQNLGNPAPNLIKAAYKRYLQNFEDFYRKLGCTMVSNPRGSRTRHRSGRSLIRDCDRTPYTTKKKDSIESSDSTEEEDKKEDEEKSMKLAIKQEKKIKEEPKVVRNLRREMSQSPVNKSKIKEETKVVRRTPYTHKKKDNVESSDSTDEEDEEKHIISKLGIKKEKKIKEEPKFVRNLRREMSQSPVQESKIKKEKESSDSLKSKDKGRDISKEFVRREKSREPIREIIKREKTREVSLVEKVQEINKDKSKEQIIKNKAKDAMTTRVKKRELPRTKEPDFIKEPRTPRSKSKLGEAAEGKTRSSAKKEESETEEEEDDDEDGDDEEEEDDEDVDVEKEVEKIKSITSKSTGVSQATRSTRYREEEDDDDEDEDDVDVEKVDKSKTATSKSIVSQSTRSTRYREEEDEDDDEDDDVDVEKEVDKSKLTTSKSSGLSQTTRSTRHRDESNEKEDAGRKSRHRDESNEKEDGGRKSRHRDESNEKEDAIRKSNFTPTRGTKSKVSATPSGDGNDKKIVRSNSSLLRQDSSFRCKSSTPPPGEHHDDSGRGRGGGSAGRGRGRGKRVEGDRDPRVGKPLIPHHVPVMVGDKLKVLYGPNAKESKVTYEAKVLEVEEEGNAPMYYVHYLGWNIRYDEWIRRPRIAANLTWDLNRAKKGRAATTKEIKEKKEKEKEMREDKSSASTSSPKGLMVGSKRGRQSSVVRERRCSERSDTSGTSTAGTPFHTTSIRSTPKERDNSNTRQLPDSPFSSVEQRKSRRTGSVHQDTTESESESYESDGETCSEPTSSHQNEERQSNNNTSSSATSTPITEPIEDPVSTLMNTSLTTENKSLNREKEICVKEEQNQNQNQHCGKDIDLNAIMSEMKGLDKPIKKEGDRITSNVKDPLSPRASTASVILPQTLPTPEKKTVLEAPSAKKMMENMTTPAKKMIESPVSPGTPSPISGDSLAQTHEKMPPSAFELESPIKVESFKDDVYDFKEPEPFDIGEMRTRKIGRKSGGAGTAGEDSEPDSPRSAKKKGRPKRECDSDVSESDSDYGPSPQKRAAIMSKESQENPDMKSPPHKVTMELSKENKGSMFVPDTALLKSDSKDDLTKSSIDLVPHTKLPVKNDLVVKSDLSIDEETNKIEMQISPENTIVKLETPGSPSRAIKTPGSPSRVVKTPGSPSRAVKTPGSPSRAVKTPGSPSRAVKRPGSPLRAVKTPGSPTRTIKTPGSPTRTIKTPGSPSRAVETPGSPSRAVNTPGSPSRTMRTPGSPSSEMKTPGSPPSTLETPRSPPSTLETPGSPPSTLENPGSPPSTLETPGSPPSTLKSPGSPPSTLKSPGSPPSTLKSPGSPPMALKTPGSTPMALKTPGSTPMLLKTPGSPSSILKTDLPKSPFPKSIKSDSSKPLSSEVLQSDTSSAFPSTNLSISESVKSPTLSLSQSELEKSCIKVPQVENPQIMPTMKVSMRGKTIPLKIKAVSTVDRSLVSSSKAIVPIVSSFKQSVALSERSSLTPSGGTSLGTSVKHGDPSDSQIRTTPVSTSFKPAHLLAQAVPPVQSRAMALAKPKSAYDFKTEKPSQSLKTEEKVLEAKVIPFSQRQQHIFPHLLNRPTELQDKKEVPHKLNTLPVHSPPSDNLQEGSTSSSQTDTKVQLMKRESADEVVVPKYIPNTTADQHKDIKQETHGKNLDRKQRRSTGRPKKPLSKEFVPDTSEDSDTDVKISRTKVERIVKSGSTREDDNLSLVKKSHRNVFEFDKKLGKRLGNDGLKEEEVETDDSQTSLINKSCDDKKTVVKEEDEDDNLEEQRVVRNKPRNTATARKMIEEAEEGGLGDLFCEETIPPGSPMPQDNITHDSEESHSTDLKNEMPFASVPTGSSFSNRGSGVSHPGQQSSQQQSQGSAQKAEVTTEGPQYNVQPQQIPQQQKLQLQLQLQKSNQVSLSSTTCKASSSSSQVAASVSSSGTVSSGSASLSKSSSSNQVCGVDKISAKSHGMSADGKLGNNSSSLPVSSAVGGPGAALPVAAPEDLRGPNPTAIDNTPPTTPESIISNISDSPRRDNEPGKLDDTSKSGRDSSEVEQGLLEHGKMQYLFSEDSNTMDSTTHDSSSIDASRGRPSLGMHSSNKRTSLGNIGTEGDGSETEEGVSSYIKPRKRRKGPRSRASNDPDHNNDDDDGSNSRKSSGSGNFSSRRRRRHSSARSGNIHMFTQEEGAASALSVLSLAASAHSHQQNRSRYNFCQKLDPDLDATKRITVLQNRIHELKRTYMQVKTELASVERRRKKLRRKEREKEANTEAS